MKRKATQNDGASEALTADILGWIAADEARIAGFLAATGLAPCDLRRAAAEPGFDAAVLDHVMADEKLLMACAAALELRPERIAAAWHRSRPAEFDDTM